MTGKPLRVLCLDIEGGYGGSSRSLYYLLKHVDRERVSPEVWCKREGPIQPMYEALGIPVRVEPGLPKVSSLPRLSRSAYAHFRHLADFIAGSGVRERLAHEVTARFDVVHFNHEAFYLLARWLRSRTRAAFAMHNRTLLWDTWFARRQARCLVEYNDVNIFITERERENIRRLAGWDGGVVIHNAVEIASQSSFRHEGIGADGHFVVACLSSYSWLRGIDRLVDVAAALRDAGRQDIRFIVCGNMGLAGRLPGPLGAIARRGGTLADYAAECGVGDIFRFLGDVADPERILAASDILIKPSREDNPWGRDILEAMSMSCPVMACGSYEKFVVPDVSGFLYPHDDRFRASAMAEDIVRLADDPEKLKNMGLAAQAIVRKLCDGQSCAADLVSAWEQAYKDRQSPQLNFGVR